MSNRTSRPARRSLRHRAISPGCASPSQPTRSSSIFQQGFIDSVAAELGAACTPALPDVDGAAGALDRRRLARVAAAVDAGLAGPLDIETLAAAAALSPFHLARSFRRATGLTPHAYVTARRMERARELLLAGELPTAAVATMVGYSNLAHFREGFARWFGMSPAALRRHDRRAALASLQTPA